MSNSLWEYVGYQKKWTQILGFINQNGFEPFGPHLTSGLNRNTGQSPSSSFHSVGPWSVNTSKGCRAIFLCQAEWDWAMHLVRWLAKCSCGCNTMTLGQTWKNEGVSWVRSTVCSLLACSFLWFPFSRTSTLYSSSPSYLPRLPGSDKKLELIDCMNAWFPLWFPKCFHVEFLYFGYQKSVFFPGWELLSYTWVYVKFISRHHVMPAWSNVRDPAHSTW